MWLKNPPPLGGEERCGKTRRRQRSSASRLALPGRYVFDNEIFKCLREVRPGRGGEIQLTDGMVLLASRKGMLACTLDALRFDAGDKLGFIQANIEIGLRHPENRRGPRRILAPPLWGKPMILLWTLF